MCDNFSISNLLLKIFFVEILVTLIFSSLVKTTDSKEEKQFDEKNFEELYAVGTRSYLDNDWDNCIKYLEKSLEKYKTYQNSLVRCKRKCSDLGKRLKHSFESDVEDLHFYEKMVKTTLCLLKSCEHLKLDIHKDVLKSFNERAPYEYLQLCYYKKGELLKGASASYTHHLFDSSYDISRENVQWYRGQLPPDTELVDREAKEFGKHYLEGVKDYDKKNWKLVIESMENAIKTYLSSEEECRLLCEKPFDMGWYPDFIASISNHFTFVLKCKQQCQEHLNQIGEQKIENIFPLMYFYLMFAYYKENDFEKTASCIASHQMLVPGDKEMESNKRFFVEEEALNLDLFVARVEAVEYFNRDKYEKHLLDFINKQFVFDEEDQMDIYTTIENDTKETEDSKVLEDIKSKNESNVSSPLHGEEL